MHFLPNKSNYWVCLIQITIFAPRESRNARKEVGNYKTKVKMGIIFGGLIGGAIALAVVSFIVDFFDKCL
jgi:hypothetical protein